MSDALFEVGINAPAMTYPIVARGEARLRIQVNAAHTDGDLDQVAQTISRCIGQTSSQAPAVDYCRLTEPMRTRMQEHFGQVHVPAPPQTVL